jgi:hypothetical protein
VIAAIAVAVGVRRQLDDAGPEADALGLGAPPRERREGVGAVGLGGPQRVETEPLGLLDRLQRARRWSGGPIADAVAELDAVRHVRER